MGNQSGKEANHNHNDAADNDEVLYDFMVPKHIRETKMYGFKVPQHIRDTRTNDTDNNNKTTQTITTFRTFAPWALTQGQLREPNNYMYSTDREHGTRNTFVNTALVHDYLHESALRLEQLQRHIAILKSLVYGQVVSGASRSTSSAADKNEKKDGDDIAEEQDEKQEDPRITDKPSREASSSSSQQDDEDDRKSLVTLLQDLQKLSANITLQRQDVQQISTLLLEQQQQQQVPEQPPKPQGQQPKQPAQHYDVDALITRLYSLVRQGTQQLAALDAMERRHQELEEQRHAVTTTHMSNTAAA